MKYHGILLLIVSFLLQSLAFAQHPVRVPGPGGHSAVSVTPTLVQGVYNGTTINNAVNTALGTQGGTLTGACPTLTYCIWFPNQTLNQDAIEVTVFYASSPSTTMSVSTDKSQSLSSIATSSAQDSIIGQAFVLCNATAGTQELQIAETTGTVINQVFAEEWAGVPLSGCVDTQAATNGATTTSPLGGSVTPSQSGDILSTHIFRASGLGCTSDPCFTAGSQSNITWVKRGAGYDIGGAFEWGTYTSTSAINPAMTFATTSSYIGLTVAFKADTTHGTNPSGMYVVYEDNCNTPASAGTTQNCEAPVTSAESLLVSQQNCGGLDVDSVTDATNTWYKPGWRSSQKVASGTISNLWYTPAPGTSLAANAGGAITFHVSGSNDCTFKIYHMAGAAATPFANRVIAPNANNTNQTVTIATFFPGITNGWIFAASSQHTNTAGSVSAPTGALFESTTWGGQNRDGPSLPDQNNFWGTLPNTSNASQTWTYGTIFNTADEGNYGAEIASFASATGAFSGGPSQVQDVTAQVSSCASPCTLAVPLTTATSSGTALVMRIGMNRSGGPLPTVTNVCTDGTTCAAGNKFTQATSAYGSFGTGHASDIWYLFGHASGVTTVTIQFNTGTITNGEGELTEERNISTFDTAIGGSGTGVANINTAASITTAAHTEFIPSIMVVSNSITVTPASGNGFGYSNTIFSNTLDATGALIATTGTYSFAAKDAGATDSFCASTAAFF